MLPSAPRHRRLGRRALLALGIAAAAALAAPAQGVAPCSAVTRLADGWDRIKPPTFGSGGASVTSHDVVPGQPERLVASNGREVMTSASGGCSWVPSAVPSSPALAALPTQEGGGLADESITSVRADLISSSNVWAAGVATVLRQTAAVSRPRVLVSSDGGRSFTDRSAGLPELGEPIAIRPALRGWGYVLFHTSLPAEGYALYGTNDSGVTWNEQVASLPAGLSDITVDLTTGDAYLFGSAGLYVVEPAASSARRVSGAPGDVTAVTAEYFRSADNNPGKVTAFLRTGQARYETTDRGHHVRIADAPYGVRSASAGILPGLLAMAADQPNVYVEPPRAGGFSKRPAADFSPFEDSLTDVRFVLDLGYGAGFRLYGANAKALYRRVIPLSFIPPRPPPLPSTPVTVNGRTPARAPATLLPREKVVSLLPGQRATVDYRLSLPPVPTPLDVFFMTDSTGSMSTAITSVQENLQRIVDDLYDSGIDVQFGVADFRDYPEQSQAGQQNDNYPYKLRRKIGPVNSELADAIESLTVGGGTADGDDSALEAIYQAVTGAGRPDPLLARGHLIPPGQGADFRDNALKVVFVASDDEMRHPGASTPRTGGGLPNAGNPGYPGPSLDTVAKALSAYGVHLVGLAVKTTDASPRTDMEALAAASNTLAPAEGIDCDADGSASGEDDVRAGQPIVCGFNPDSDAGIAPTFFALLKGIRDYGPVDLAVSGPAGLVRPTAPLHYPKVNLKAPSQFSLPVEFSCDAEHAGTESAVEVSAQTRGRDAALARATLRCLTPAKPAFEPPPLVTALVPVAVAPIAPPPPPANPVPNPNPNPQLNPNAGFATNEEQQAQLALAESDAGESESADEVAFAALRQGSEVVPDLAWVGAAMLLSCAAFGVHLARGRRTALAEQPVS